MVTVMEEMIMDMGIAMMEAMDIVMAVERMLETVRLCRLIIKSLNILEFLNYFCLFNYSLDLGSFPPYSGRYTWISWSDNLGDPHAHVWLDDC